MIGCDPGRFKRFCSERADFRAHCRAMRILRSFVTLSAMIFCVACASTERAKPVATAEPTTGPAINRFEKEIDAYLDADKVTPPPQGAIVFTGSSSIRGWRSLKKDFPDLDVIGRGFGGSSTIDVFRYADALVLKHRPRTVVFYCGENDLTAPKTTPQDVLRHFTTFVDLVHRELPKTKIVFISLKPSPSRIALIETFRETNALIKAYVETDDRLSYVNVFDAMLDETGQPRAELFLNDRLHMTPAGFAIWTKLVRPHLE